MPAELLRREARQAQEVENFLIRKSRLYIQIFAAKNQHALARKKIEDTFDIEDTLTWS